MDSLKTTKEILNKYDIKAKKAFGQNFLTDDIILKKIADLALINKDDLVIEIGPGLGNLTYYLSSATLLAIEIDEKMIEILNNRFVNNSNIKIINKDVLKIDIDKEVSLLEDEKNIKFKNVKVVANLPYYITSPIIFKLLEDSKRVSEVIVMIQEEVADRIVAKPNSKDYGILTVMIDYFAKARKEIIVPNTSFIPSPNVSSSVISILKEEKNWGVDYKVFKELVHKAFANRRKKLLNSLCINNFLSLDKERIREILNLCGLSDNARAEELNIEKYVEIIKNI